ncbi:MAG: type 1 glutamine amidotransferase [Verrucomicrobia bacterium]|nr:type 1 glutamine amidotransferase [Verrucomicrobiota bacterium]
MNDKLINKRVAILVTDGVEQAELEGPLRGLEDEGAIPLIVSLKPGRIQAMHHADKGEEFEVDETLDHARAQDFDALVIPGGLLNPDTLRATPAAVDFVREFANAGKPIAAICHGPWLLIEAGLVEGRRLTSWPAIKTDVRNAGGEWVDEPVVVDNGLVTSRMPADIPAFNAKMVEEFAEGYHEGMQSFAKQHAR